VQLPTQTETELRPCVRQNFPNFLFLWVSENFGCRSSEIFRKKLEFSNSECRALNWTLWIYQKWRRRRTSWETGWWQWPGTDHNLRRRESAKRAGREERVGRTIRRVKHVHEISCLEICFTNSKTRYIKAQFHQCSTYSFCACKSQKRKKILMT